MSAAAESIALLAESRPGFQTLACTPVALPFWRLRVRVEVLARRHISPLEEFVLRAAIEADRELSAIRGLLGLDQDTFEGVIASVIGQEWAKVDPQLRLRLTDKGTEMAASAIRERSEERVVVFDYDGLLRRPALLDVPLEPQQRRAMGLRELPAMPSSAPDELELRDSALELQALIRRAGDGRDQEVDLLAVKGVLRKDRVFREATLIIFRSSTGSIQAAPVLDGVLSEAHEHALAAPGVTRELRLAGEMRRGRRFDQLVPQAVRSLRDGELEAQALRLRLEARHARAQDEEAGEPVRAAVAAMRRLPVRWVGPHEHPQLLQSLVKSTKKRLLIATPAITPASIDRDLLAALRNLLKTGADVTIVHGTEEEELAHALAVLAGDYENLQLLAGATLPSSTVVRDDTLALRTLFPILAFRGRERPFRDERGWLVSAHEHVRVLAEEATPPDAQRASPARNTCAGKRSGRRADARPPK